MDEAADALRIGRRSFQEIVKRYPFYYPNGRRKLFTDADVEAIRYRVCPPEAMTPKDVVRNFIAQHMGSDEIMSFLAFVDKEALGSVYLVRCHDRLKIGYTTHWERRWRVLRTSCPYPPALVALFPGGREFEKFLHYGLDEWRENGEWFRMEGGVADLVSQIEKLDGSRQCR